MKKLALLVVLTVTLGLVGAMYATPASAFFFGGFGGGGYNGGGCCPTYCAPMYCAPMCCAPYCGPAYGCYPAYPGCKGKVFKKARMKKVK